MFCNPLKTSLLKIAKVFTNRGLAFKFSIYILTVVSLLFFLTLFYNYQVSKKLLLNESRQVAMHLTNTTITKIGEVLKSIQKIPLRLVYIIEKTDVEEEELIKMLNAVVKNNDELFGSCIAFEPNSFVNDQEQFAPYFYRTEEGIKYKELGHTDYNYFNWDWYKIPKEQGISIWSEPYLDEGGGDVIMATYSIPFYADTGSNRKFAGVVTADMSLTWLETLIDSIKIYESGYAFIVSNNGTIITHPQDQITMTETMSSLAQKYQRSDLELIAKEMMMGKSNFLEYQPLFNDEPCRIYYAPLRNSNWSMALVFPEKELFEDLNELFWEMLLIGFLGIIVLIVVIILISRSIIHPLTELSLTATKIGRGNFDVEIPDSLNTRELLILGNSLKRMQHELKEYVINLKETTAANEKIESELNIAHDIQLGMIPKIFPPFPNRIDVDLHAILNPARQVGGDFYDFFFLEDDVLCFAVGDVSDKGVPASLMMAITITLLRAKAKTIDDPSDIVFSMNQDLSEENENMMFVTMFLGILDLKTREMKFCNAGHNYPYVLKYNGNLITIEETHGTPLGIYYDQKYQSGKTTLEEGDNLIVYTDGVSEAMNMGGEPYGENRLEKLIEVKCNNRTPAESIEQIMNDVEVFTGNAEQSDDITLLSVLVK